MDNVEVNFGLLKSAGLIPNIMDDFLKEIADKEELATILLYLSAAVQERITIQECILRYESKNVDDDGPRFVPSPHGMIADRIYYETKLMLVRRAPVNIESDVVNHTLDSVAKGFIEKLRNKLKL